LDDPDNVGIGAASMAELVCVQPSPENERNIAGIVYRVTGADDETQNGLYIAFEGRQTEDTIMGLNVRLDREKRELPFTVRLNSFQRDVYPGSNMPRNYESRVTIEDGDVTWPAIISMNEPLRYGGYTLYQASTYLDKDGQPVSVLSVVTNKGWIFPYISGILLAIGLIWHMVLRAKRP
jgi:cytochrome c biogenesis protein ResB